MNDWERIPAALADLDLDSLAGLTVAQARAWVEAAGGELRAVTAGEGVTFDLRPRRVTVLVDDDRTGVVQVLGRG